MTTSVLVMGGSHFLGRAVAVEALRRSWSVTVFNRGKSGRNPDGVRAVQGDRTHEADLARLAGIGPWDAIIDTSGMSAGVVDLATRTLSESMGRYVYVSTVSVYAGWPMLPLTEDLPTLAEAEPMPGLPADVNVAYGEDKAQAEMAARTRLGNALTILRPGVILGPEEYVGRLPWWLRRIARGGRVLAPGSPEQTIAPVDARDVAAFACDRAAAGDDGELPPGLCRGDRIQRHPGVGGWRVPPRSRSEAVDRASALEDISRHLGCIRRTRPGSGARVPAVAGNGC